MSLTQASVMNGAPMLFQDLCTAPNLRSDEVVSFNDPFLQELINSRPLRRLKSIGFLGAIDYIRRGSGQAANRRRHSRYEHSVGVGKLAEQFSTSQELPEHSTRVLISAGLLHDVGHGPLSHTLEPIFEQKFGVNHHLMTKCILHGETKFGSEIADIFQKYSVDLDETLAMINGEHHGEHSFLFSSQINLDTLEGITRCRAFLGQRPATRSASQIVKRLSFDTDLTTNDFDDFWDLKHKVYKLFINGSVGLTLDAIAQAYMREFIDQFSPSDFMKTERSLREKHASLFELFDLVRKNHTQIKSVIPKKLFSNLVQVKNRAFYIDGNKPLKSDKEINKRYCQTKVLSELSLEEIIS